MTRGARRRARAGAPRFAWHGLLAAVVALATVAGLAGAGGAARAQQDPFDRTAGLIGLLPLPEVFGESVCTPFEPRAIPLYASATATDRAGEIRVTSPWRFPPEGGCEGLEVRVVRGDGPPSELPTLEYGYEEVAAIVLARDGRRAQVALASGAAWLDAGDGSRFLSVEALLPERLSYLRRGALPLLRRAPDMTAPRVTVASTDDPEVLADVLETRRVGEALWVRVALLEENECAGEPTGQRADTAWVPFHGADRRPTVWFHSRGC